MSKSVHPFQNLAGTDRKTVKNILACVLCITNICIYKIEAILMIAFAHGSTHMFIGYHNKK